MNLVVDIGNTRTKVSFFEGENVVEQSVFPQLTLAQCEKWWQDNRFTAAIVSASGRDTEGVVDFLRTKTFVIALDHTTPLPVQNSYGTPHTLGKDRLAAAIGAGVLFPDTACMVIDSGTCITYDVIDMTGAFLGGNIAPGLDMRLKAMHHFTAKLPLVAAATEVPLELLGKSTVQALRNGAQIGLLAEIEGMISRFEQEMGPLQILLTGGDSPFIKQHLSHNRVLQTDILVSIGLNAILNYNKKMVE